MKIEGSYRVPGPRSLVWELLLNPQVLARSLRGCEKLEQQGDHTYRAQLRVGIAVIKGSYHGQVRILDPVPPHRFRMQVEGQGAGAFLKGDGTLILVENSSETTVSYAGEAQVGGTIASVGQRMVQAAAKHIINEFFAAFAVQVQQAALQITSAPLPSTTGEPGGLSGPGSTSPDAIPPITTQS